MCSFRYVPFLACAIFSMCHFRHMKFLSCALFGMYDVCTLFGMWFFWHELFSAWAYPNQKKRFIDGKLMLPFWNVLFSACAIFGMCSFCHVPFLACTLFGMCSFQQVLFLACVHFWHERILIKVRGSVILN